MNISHPLVPLAIVLACWGRQIELSVGPSVRTRSLVVGSILAVCIGLITSKPFLRYPHWFPNKYKIEKNHVLLIHNPPDIDNLPAIAADNAEKFRAFTRELNLLSKNHSVAIMTEDDTLLYLASNIRPWYRYTPILALFMTPEDFNMMAAKFAAEPPDYVVLSASETWKQVADLCRAMVTTSYTKRSTRLGYEIWERKPR